MGLGGRLVLSVKTVGFVGVGWDGGGGGDGDGGVKLRANTTRGDIVAVLLCSSHPFCCARDTVTYDTPITDGVESETLVSSGGRFELGFFSPSPEGTQRYVGIWYHQLSPRTVVWVANREKAVDNSTSNGSLALQDGNLHVLDAAGKRYWSTEVETSESLTQTVTLMDSGNLVLSSGHDKLAVNILWQSFQSPTDTFIPGMVMDKSLVLTSWRGEDDPESGRFIFKKDPVREDHKKYVVGNSSKVFSSPSQNSSYKNPGIPPRSEYNYTSCNSNNRPLLCKCLPGFKPQYLQQWNSGDFSGGCKRDSALCGNNKIDTFLSLKKMKVGNPDSKINVEKEEEECRNGCLNSCQCKAYSYAISGEYSNRRDASLCKIWNEGDLNNLEEEYTDGGQDLSVRVALSDLGILPLKLPETNK
nr:G-type lectin S-receptor-like serine/threonine-protein kinase At4g03230 [Malus domestica]